VGCSGDDDGSTGINGSAQAVCTLVERLDGTGDDVAAADVKDPSRFNDALDDAVEQYTEVLDDLDEVAPPELRDDVERLRAAVEQYRFADGLEAHAALDAYASRACA
jgi:hypothetical protein